jgi:hypothetical protein
MIYELKYITDQARIQGTIGGSGGGQQRGGSC